ncbi:MAG: response regulator [bacterium]|nr:response regulator [bacterium]
MKRILIIDDDSQVLEGLKRLMMDEGFYVECAENAIKAVEIAESKEFDLMIVDIILPKTDGIELTRQIKKISPDIAVVIITGHPSEEYEKEVQSLDVKGYLIKPFSTKEIIANVRDILDESG